MLSKKEKVILWFDRVDENPVWRSRRKKITEILKYRKVYTAVSLGSGKGNIFRPANFTFPIQTVVR